MESNIGTKISQLINELKERQLIGQCLFCKVTVDINEFRDELSRKEFRISGLCQKCQDEFFVEA